MKYDQSQAGPLRTIAYFDQIIYAADFTGKSQLTPTDRIVALAILHYVNRKAGATYVDLLTLARRVGIKHPTVKMASRHLSERGHLKVIKRPGKTPLLRPILRECDGHSSRGDKAFYAARGKLIDRLVFDRRLTPAERLAGLAFLATFDPETCRCESQVSVAQNCGLSRDMLYKRALPKLEAFGYIARESDGVAFDLVVDIGGEVLGEVLGEVTECEKARQIAVSHRNSMDLVNSTDPSFVAQGRDSIRISIAPPMVKLPDATAVASWRHNVYPFLVADGPLCGIHPSDMPALVDSGLLSADGEITALGHAIGAPATSTTLKQEAA